ncbi:MAG: beta-galactosidase [Phycisphaerae bacterium]|nr:beta-galactosidase [Phycisphaerae bacterium]
MAKESVRLPEFEIFMWIYNSLYKHPDEKVRQAYQRFRDMGCTGGMVYTGAKQNYREERSLDHHLADNWPFYVENLSPAFLTHWGAGKKEFLRQYEEFGRTRDRKVFTKVPCLNDPKVLEEQRALVRSSVTDVARGRRLARYWDIRDEPSVGAFILANDTCFCDHCMGRMRNWLRAEVYPSLDALNAAWGTTFASWDDVSPLTTEEIIERRRAKDYNFAPWCEHRSFMDKTFVDFYEQMAQVVHEIVPEALVGLEGTQAPCAFGGYDFSRWVPAMQWLEPYAFGGSMEAIRSFKTGPITIFHTSGLGGDSAHLRTALFNGVLDGGGHAGSIIWQSEYCVDLAGATPKLTPKAEQFAEAATFMRSGFSSLLTRAEEQSDGVALLYSQRSIQSAVPLQLPDRRRSWGMFRQEDTSLDCKSRLAWLDLLYDLGLRPSMVSSAQVEAGALLEKGVKLLVLPWALALSEKEVDSLRRFVEAGGVVVADSMPGRFDGHGKAYAGECPADSLFGVVRGEPGEMCWAEQMLFVTKGLDGKDLPGGQARPRGDGVEDLLGPREGAFCMAATETTGTGAMFVNRIGKGLAILLNVMPLNYAASRLAGGGGEWRRLAEMFMKAARVKPRVSIAGRDGQPIVGWHRAVYRHGKATLVAVVGDLAVRQGTLGATEQARGESAGVAAVLDLGKSGYVYEATTGAYLGKGGKGIKDTLRLGWPRLYVVLPYRVKSMKLTARRDGGQVRFDAQLSASGPMGEHAFRAELLDAKGRLSLESGASFLAARGRCSATVEIPKSLVGAVTLRVRDVATGVTARVRLARPAK